MQAVVRAAAAAGLQVKAAGSLHTFAALPETPGVEVRLDRMDRVLVVDGDRVTVEPGLTLAALNRVLAARGLALPNHGSYLGQTLAGALATATHGGSLRTGTLADAVEAVALVGADGELRRWRRSEAEFGGVVAALGLLGVMAEVTLRCVPAFHLRGEPRVLAWDEFLASFGALHRENDFLDARWHPEAGLVEVLEIRRCAPLPAPAPEVPALRPAGPAWRRRMVSANFRLLLRALGLPGAGPWRRALARRWCGHGYVASAGPAESVLAFSDLSQGEPFPIDDLEFAVPFARAGEALRALADWFAGPGRPPRFFPVHLRASAAGEHWLAANHGQDVCWLEFWDYPGDPRWQAGLAAVLAPWAPRYHLGKTLPPAAADEALHLPGRAQFLALRESLDPTGRFLNAEAGRRLGLAVPGSASGPAAAGRAAASRV
jgi:L-gulonolactone oxidase